MDSFISKSVFVIKVRSKDGEWRTASGNGHTAKYDTHVEACDHIETWALMFNDTITDIAIFEEIVHSTRVSVVLDYQELKQKVHNDMLESMISS